MDAKNVTQKEIDEMEGLFNVGVQPVELEDHVSVRKATSQKAPAVPQAIPLLPAGTVSSSEPGPDYGSDNINRSVSQGFGSPPNTLNGKSFLPASSLLRRTCHFLPLTSLNS